VFGEDKGTFTSVKDTVSSCDPNTFALFGKLPAMAGDVK